MDENQITFIRVLSDFLSEYGLPTFLVIFLLNSFQKKIDKLISLVDRLTGIVLASTKTNRGDIDGRSN